MEPALTSYECPKRLLEALDIVINRLLKENHDDTLIEQLMTLLQKTLESSSRHLHLVRDHLKCLSLSPSCDPCILRILAFIIGNSQAEYEEHLKLFVSLAGTVSSESSLSWQASFLHSLHYLLLLDCVSYHLEVLLKFFPSCCDLLTKSSSYIIKRHSEKVIVSYFEVLKVTKASSLKLDQPIGRCLLSNIDASLLDFFRVNYDKMPTFIRENVDICIKDQCSEIANGKPADEKFLSSLASLCACTCKNRDDLLSQLSFWLKRSDIRAVILLVNYFEEKQPGKSDNLRFVWLLYPCIAHYQLTDQLAEFKKFFLLEFDCHWIEQRTNARISLFALNFARETLIVDGDDEISFTFKFVKSALVKIMDTNIDTSAEKRITLSLFDLILKLSRSLPNVSGHVCSLAKDLSTLIVKSECMLSEYLFFLRQLVTESPCADSHCLCYLQITSSLLTISRFNQPFRTWKDELENHFASLTCDVVTSETNLSILEQLLTCLSHIIISHYPIGEDINCHGCTIDEVMPCLVTSLSKLWALNKCSSSFMQASLPLLIIFNYFLTSEQKRMIGFENDEEIINQFIELFDRENLISSIVHTLSETVNSTVFIHFHSSSPSLYKTFAKGVIRKLVKLCLTSYDDELNAKALECVEELLSPLKNMSSTQKFILLYEVHFLEALHRFITGPYDETQVRQAAFKCTLEITSKMSEIELETAVSVTSESSSNESSELLLRKKESVSCSIDRVDDEKDKYPLHTSAFKKAVIEEMFKEFDSIPTQDILDELSARVDCTNNICERDVRVPTHLTLEQLFLFFSSFDPSTVSCEPIHMPPYGILDDIINAKSNINSAAPDCY